MAVLLNKFEEMSYAEIAEVMGRSEAAVKSLLARARTNLREHLEPYLEDRAEGAVIEPGRAAATSATGRPCGAGGRPAPGGRSTPWSSRGVPVCGADGRAVALLRAAAGPNCSRPPGRPARVAPCRSAPGGHRQGGCSECRGRRLGFDRGDRAGALPGADPPPLPEAEARAERLARPLGGRPGRRGPCGGPGANSARGACGGGPAALAKAARPWIQPGRGPGAAALAKRLGLPDLAPCDGSDRRRR